MRMCRCTLTQCIYIYTVWLAFSARHHHLTGTLHPKPTCFFSSASAPWHFSDLDRKGWVFVHLDLPFVCKTWPAFSTKEKTTKIRVNSEQDSGISRIYPRLIYFALLPGWEYVLSAHVYREKKNIFIRCVMSKRILSEVKLIQSL